MPTPLPTIDTHRGPLGNYRGIRRQLPNPPFGHVWIQEAKTRKWYLVDTMETTSNRNHCRGGGGGSVGFDIIAEDVQIVDNDKENTGSIMEHLVQPHETFEGICLRYGVTGTILRQCNGGFSGTNLQLGPNPLKIPPSLKLPRYPSKPFMVDQLQRAYPALSPTEASAYLELNDYDMAEASANVQEDRLTYQHEEEETTAERNHRKDTSCWWFKAPFQKKIA